MSTNHISSATWRYRVKTACVVFLPMLLLLVVAGLSAPARAVQPDEILKDPALEMRARELGKHLRCVVCQNQSIDDSNAPLARDLRIIVRERLTAGDTDAEAMNYIVARYGNYVLLKPPFQINTLALWLGPVALLLLGFWGFRGVLARRAQAPVNSSGELTPAERRQLDDLMESEGRS